MNTMPLEQDTRVLIDTSLENLGWKLKGNDKNVFLEQPRTEKERKKLGGKRPDYVLYSKESEHPLIVIEAKRKGTRLDDALEQGVTYARNLDAPLVFATDGVFCKAFHTGANRPPILNGEEIDELIRETLALKYLNSYEVNTVSLKVQYDRKELIRVFDEANNMLRGEGLRAGIERFGEFANILFLKLISESELIKKESGIRSDFDEACSWESIKQIPVSARIDYINKQVYEKLNKLYKTEIFTPLQIRDVNILKEIMGKLDPLMLTDVESDVKGDAFEYFLKASTATKNDLGEYFTPRHIVKTMVRLVNPKIGETVYDPFCGTGGFLIESFRYIYNNMARTEAYCKLLKESTIYGNEITNTARITKMNMILAGDGHSNIKMEDSLANPIDGNSINTDKDGKVYHNGYDIVLTNMPYSQRTKHGDKYDLPSSNGDSICIQHCIKAINSTSENGRMALVVPEGFLFRKDMTRTREYLLNRCDLQSIISLPQGVFLPYTGVKTDIVFATNVNKKKRDEKKKYYWYFDVKSDGYTLDNHRRKTDAPSDLTKYEEYRKLDDEQKEEMLSVGFEVIPFEKIKKNSYILVGNRYRSYQKKVNSGKAFVKLGEFVDLTRGVSFPKSLQKNTPNDNCIGVVTTKAAQADGIKEENVVYVEHLEVTEEKFLRKDDILISLANSLDFIGRVTYVNKNYSKLTFGAFVGLIRVDKSRINPKYLYWILQSQEAKDYFKSVAKTTTNISNLTFEDLNKFAFPLPSLEDQAQVVMELDQYQNIIDGSKKVVNSYKPHLCLSDELNTKKLGDLFDFISDNIDPKTKEGNTIYIGLENIESETGNIIGTIESRYDSIRSVKHVFKKGDILYGKLRPALNKVAYMDYDGICSTDLLVLRPKTNDVSSEFYSILLRDKQFNKTVLDGVEGGQLPRVSVSYLSNLPIPLVPMDEQYRLLNEILHEKSLIDPLKEMDSLWRNKIGLRIKEIWGEK